MDKEFERHKTELNIEVQKFLNPYFALFMGAIVNYSMIQEEAPQCLPALERLMADGKVKSQLDPDNPAEMLLWMPTAVKAVQERSIKGFEEQRWD